MERQAAQLEEQTVELEAQQAEMLASLSLKHLSSATRNKLAAC
mgnify:CR=1 FL=1